jgi:hypothetical protein
MSHRPSSKSASIIAQCEAIIKSFNPVTHSIDTHVLDVLGDVTLPVSDTGRNDWIGTLMAFITCCMYMF